MGEKIHILPIVIRDVLYKKLVAEMKKREETLGRKLSLKYFMAELLQEYFTEQEKPSFDSLGKKVFPDGYIKEISYTGMLKYIMKKGLSFREAQAFVEWLIEKGIYRREGKTLFLVEEKESANSRK